MLKSMGHSSAINLTISSLSCLFLLNCMNSDEVTKTQQSVVYGTDNRQDVYAFSDEGWKARAMESTVAIIGHDNLDISDPQNIKISEITLKQDHNLCEGERFPNQITAAFCSGTLIDDDKVLTAGHCFWTQSECKSARFVFHYAMKTDNEMETVTSEDVFGCSKILVKKFPGNIDYSIIQLDRPATPRFKPAPLRMGLEAIAKDTRLMVIGSGSGLPMKLDDGGFVTKPRENTKDYFVANTDTFGGNSGSGVYDLATGEVIGILVRGESDYRYDYGKRCNRVNVCEESGCRGEDVTYLGQALRGLCEKEPRVKLCSEPSAETTTTESTAGNLPVDENN